MGEGSRRRGVECDKWGSGRGNAYVSSVEMLTEESPDQKEAS